MHVPNFDWPPCPSDFGVLRVAHSIRSCDECLVSAVTLLVHAPNTHQTQIFATVSAAKMGNAFSPGSLQNVVDWWSEIPENARVPGSDQHIHGHGYKLWALLNSPYNRTLLLDCDVLILSPSHTAVIRSALGRIDVAWTHDWTPFMRTLTPLPMACACIMGVRRGEGTTRLLTAALLRYERGNRRDGQTNYTECPDQWHPHPTTTTPCRWGDQEAIWYELNRGEAAESYAALRFMLLPDEFQCAAAGNLFLRGRKHVLSVGSGPYKHACLAAHGHLFRDPKVAAGEGLAWLRSDSHLPFAVGEEVLRRLA